MRTVGFEFEHVSTMGYGGLQRRLQAESVRVYDAETDGRNRGFSMTSWVIKADGTLPTGGIELVSPPLDLGAEHGREDLRVALGVARKHGKITRQCGLHVHVFAGDLTNAEIDNLKRAWVAIENVAFSYVAPSRRRNQYCTPGASNTDRYHALNLATFNRTGTAEFRLHHGTLKYERAVNWALMLVGLVDYARNCEGERLQPIHPELQELTMCRVGAMRELVLPAYANDKMGELAKHAVENGHNPRPMRTFPVTVGGMGAVCKSLSVTDKPKKYLSRMYANALQHWGPCFVNPAPEREGWIPPTRETDADAEHDETGEETEHMDGLNYQPQ